MSARESLAGGEPPEVVEPQVSTGRTRTREARARLACAARARVSATLLNTFLRPAATIPSPETRPDWIEGARRGGGSEPALLFRPSASWLASPLASG